MVADRLTRSMDTAEAARLGNPDPGRASDHHAGDRATVVREGGDRGRQPVLRSPPSPSSVTPASFTITQAQRAPCSRAQDLRNHQPAPVTITTCPLKRNSLVPLASQSSYRLRALVRLTAGTQAGA